RSRPWPGQQPRRDRDCHHGRAGGRADKGKARFVEHKGLSSLQHDVAWIVRLGNPDRAFETLDREPLAIVDIKQLTGVEANAAIHKMSCHGGLPGMSMTHVTRRWTSTCSPGRAQATPETCLPYGGVFAALRRCSTRDTDR